MCDTKIKFLVCRYLIVLFALMPMLLFGATKAHDSLEITAYKDVPPAAGETWLSIRVQDGSAHTLGTGQPLDLGDGSAYRGTTQLAFYFQVTGTAPNQVDVSFDFVNFITADKSESITGTVEFRNLSSDFNGNDGYYYPETYWKTYRYQDNWPQNPSSKVSLNGGRLSVSGMIAKQTKDWKGKWSDVASDTPNQAYIRNGSVFLRLDADSYDQATSGIPFTSTVTVSCTYNG